MKISPVSADLMIKLALAGVTVLAVVYVARKVTGAAGNAFAAVGDAAQYINPASDQNVIYQTANWAVEGLTGDSNQTLGGWIYDVTHPEPIAPVNTGGATGGW